MSVLASKRGDSDVEFLDVARRLEAETLDYVLKLPKRLTFFLSTEIMRWGHEVYNHVKAANSVYISRRSDVEKRRDHWIEANCALQILGGKIRLAYDTLTQNPEHFAEGEKDSNRREEKIRKGKERLEKAQRRITSLINEEAVQISKIKDSDKRREKKLPE